MENQIIDIGTKIDLTRLLDSRLLIQASSGGGKSFLQRKLIESVGNSVQQIILDIEGEYVTLREKFNFALVGKDGDIPLSVKYAEMLAYKLLETGMSAIIDLYELKHHERILFVKRFLDAMLNAPKELWHSCLVYIDEAHVFCPEGSKSESASAVIDLCTRGRKRGFAAVLATQRMSKLRKDAAAECLNKMIGRTGLDIDRRRAAEELGFSNKVDHIGLRNLKPGNFHGYGPAISDTVVTFKVSKVITTHPQAGKRITTIPPTPGAIKKILAKLENLPEEAEKDLQTKQQLQEEVKRLNLLLNVEKVVTHTTDYSRHVNEQKLKESQNENKKLVIRIGILERQLKNALAPLEKLYSILKASTIANDTFTDVKVYIEADDLRSESIPDSVTIKQSWSENPVKKVPESYNKLGKCELAIMKFLAQYDRSFTKAQVAIMAGYSPISGGFNNALSKLSTMGLILRNDGNLSCNRQVDWFNYTGPLETVQYSVNTFKEKLGKCEREIFQVLLNHAGMSFTKEELAGKTDSGYSPTSGGFNNSLAKMSTLELIQRSKNGISLNPELIELL